MRAERVGMGERGRSSIGVMSCRWEEPTERLVSVFCLLKRLAVKSALKSDRRATRISIVLCIKRIILVDDG